jgi:hypothetical protein
MEISAVTVTKSGITSNLVFGYGDGRYFVCLDDVVIVEPTTVSRAAQARFCDVRAGLVSCGWTIDTTPAFVGR